MDLRGQIFFLIAIVADSIWRSHSFNVGTAGAKIFTGPAAEEFGYQVQQATNHEGKWLLVSAPWSGYTRNRKGDVYKCPLSESRNSCDKLNLQDSLSIPDVKNININMSLGLTLTQKPDGTDLLMCGPLWAQQCGSQQFYPGICARLTPLFQPQSAFSPAVQKCGGPMDIVIVLDGSNSIYPWEPMTAFIQKLIPTLDIGPQTTQVSVIQYAVDPKFEFRLNEFRNKEDMLSAASRITQMSGYLTNTFQAIQYASQWGFHPSSGSRPGAAKVMVVVTDGESHDEAFRESVIAECNKKGITRFGIAVLGYYTRNNIDTENLIKEIKSIASEPTANYFFNVSDEVALSNIAGTLGDRIFNIEGTGKGGDNFKMEMSQVGFSAHYSSQQDVMMLGAVGAYSWSGTVVHQRGSTVDILPSSAFEETLQDKSHSSLLGYSVTSLNDGRTQYFVAGAPRSNHTGQVIVYTVSTQKQTTVIDSERGKQIGSYFGSVLCSLDVDSDGVTDLLLVGAPMFMSEMKKEEGRVYIFSVTKGILNEQGFLSGPSPTEDARFGMAISAIPDLDLDGYSDVVVGAPLEDNQKGVIYIYNGKKRMLNKEFSQRVLGSSLDPKLQYFGRSLDSFKDLNGDSLPDISVGAYGKVVQLWSRGVATISATGSFNPDKINILDKPCDINGRKHSCFTTRLCFSATFRPNNPVGPVDLSYTLTLDADLQASRVTSRGLFTKNNERFLTEKKKISSTELCLPFDVYVQETPDFVNSLSLKVEVEQQNTDVNPVLDRSAVSAWEFFIPFTKDCGSDDVCTSDLVLSVSSNNKATSSSPAVIGANNPELSFQVVVKNKKENAYNPQVLATFSSNLYYSSVFPPTDGVKCSLTQAQTVTCHVGYPALRTDQEIKFTINFDYNLQQVQNKAEVKFEAKSDGKEEKPADNNVAISIPLVYDTGVILSRESNINFYVVDSPPPPKTAIKTFDDIGPEFNFTVKVSTGTFPVSLLYLTIALPMTTKGGNELLYVTRLDTDGGSVSCDSSSLVDPLKLSTKSHTQTFSPENLRQTDKLDCKSAKCKYIKCILKDIEVNSNYFVKVKTRIWIGTFITATYQSTELTPSISVETTNPDLLLINPKLLPVVLVVSKPGEKGDIPVGVIAGSVIAGLVLLALAVGLLWKFGFFKRKYQQLQKEADDDQPSRPHDNEVL
ncbi:integrin alpha-2-like isoform X1 [Takifugu flavidus]|uniref:integrin alpha-2-like isoform X1 n=1 Tax=Takifugu flavidus TaxID=433684 RepID=UPI0025447260|nr:integrin alpha-2-like isoform X1 [Takifugu flavidus]XP_056888066.1 integrin alpha-2-like isoform X1 [Takifugu flavidus]XP_056888067.1 integrin alpha-2-like isoform X1 [Takifugu flavidus]